MLFPSALIAASVLSASVALAGPVNDSPADADGWFDVTVLKAGIIPGVTLRTFDQVENCAKTLDRTEDRGRAGWHHIEIFDCTAYIESKLGATVFKPLPAWTFDNGRLTSWDLDAPLVEVLTVTPIDRLARADFLGFSESFLGGRVNLVKATGVDARVREQGLVRLKDGRLGAVHRWVAAFGKNGNANGRDIRTLPFKPVLVRVEKENPASLGTEYRYWDKLVQAGTSGDYVIRNFTYPNGFQEPNSYDRTAELLQ